MTMRSLKLSFLLLFTPLPIFTEINPQNIQIARDKWGVPHIFAKTDPEVAYGLAYAHAEDDFKTMQLTLLSEEGWDILGGLFPGAPLVLHGVNEHLGWAHTVNSPDKIDVYQLEINPNNKKQYRFDD